MRQKQKETNKMKTIEIKCSGSGFAELEDLVPLQGDLKRLDADRYKKLKRALIEHGFSFPFFVWKHEGKLKLLDGHQRDRVLRSMKNQGYTIPPLPICTIEAADEMEARKKILLLTSQYGAMTDDTFLTFLKESEIDLDEISDTVDLPQVNVNKLLDKFIEELQPKNEQQVLEYRYQVVVDCKDESQQLEIIEKMEEVGLICHALTL